MQLVRQRTVTGPEPSPWVCRWAPLIRPGGRVLDLACGSGRHVRWLAAQGFAVTAVDRDAAAVQAVARHRAGAWSPTSKARPGRCPASASMRWSSPTTCGGRLWPELLAALADGGVLIYETFADGNQSVGKPSQTRFPAAPGRTAGSVARGLRIVAYEDGFLDAPPRFVQRIAAVARRADRR